MTWFKVKKKTKNIFHMFMAHLTTMCAKMYDMGLDYLGIGLH